MRYDPGRDLGWLLLRPWVAIPRLLHVLLSLIHISEPTRPY